MDINKMKKQIIKKVIVVLALLFVGFLLGDWYAHGKYYREPSYFECLSLGSDWARRNCLSKFNYR